MMSVYMSGHRLRGRVDSGLFGYNRVEPNAYPIAVTISRKDKTRADKQRAAVGETMNG